MARHQHYDLIVVGAGPAGLSAARTASRLGFETLVLDQSPAPGEFGHPCSAMLTTLPGFVTGRKLLGGLFYPALDLLIPETQVIGYVSEQRLISPSGFESRSTLGDGADFPAAVVDKPGVLQMLAWQAESAGAKMRFNTRVTGLIEAGSQITGVRAGDEVILADMVISAEGVSRQLCTAAGLCRTTKSKQYAYVVALDLEAPAAGSGDLGQILTFGKRHTSAYQAFGNVVIPAPGRASVYFTIYSDSPRHYTDQLPWFYIQEYIEKDPRVREYLRGASVIGRSRHQVVIQDTPKCVIRDGFLSVGDATTPAGHMGILPAVYVGRQASLIAAEALDRGDVTMDTLATFQQMLRGPVMPSLESHSQVTMNLAKTTDEEIDRLCQSQRSQRDTSPFVQSWGTPAREVASELVRQSPLLVHDWRALRDVVSGRQPEKHLWEIPVN